MLVALTEHVDCISKSFGSTKSVHFGQKSCRKIQCSHPRFKKHTDSKPSADERKIQASFVDKLKEIFVEFSTSHGEVEISGQR